MHEFLVERLISAPPERIWSVLIDRRRLASGPFGITRIEGEIALGHAIRLWSAASPERAFPLKVTQMQAGRSMTWKGGMPLGLFTGTRTFALEPKGHGTNFVMRETYTGALAGLIFKSIPDLNPSFRQFADALAAATEISQ